MEVGVTVAAAETFDESNPNAVFDVAFTNTAEFSYAKDTNIYYYALLTDSTSGTALTREVIFKEVKTTAGDVTANTKKVFTLENTTNLVPTITASGGRIFYTAPAS